MFSTNIDKGHSKKTDLTILADGDTGVQAKRCSIRCSDRGRHDPCLSANFVAESGGLCNFKCGVHTLTKLGQVSFL